MNAAARSAAFFAGLLLGICLDLDLICSAAS